MKSNKKDSRKAEKRKRKKKRKKCTYMKTKKERMKIKTE